MFLQSERFFSFLLFAFITITACSSVQANGKSQTTLSTANSSPNTISVNNIPKNSTHTLNTIDDSLQYTATENFGVPLDIFITPTETNIFVGTKIDIPVNISVSGDVEEVEVLLTVEGPVTLQGSGKQIFSGLNAGGSISFVIPVIYTAEGRSIIKVSAHAKSEVFKIIWEKHEALYTIIEQGRVTTGMAGFLRLDFRRLEEDFESKIISEEQARKQARELQTPEVIIDQKPRIFIEPTPEQIELQRGLEPLSNLNDTFEPDGEVILLQNLSAKVDISQNLVSLLSAGGTITVQGTVNWRDENGLSHPAFGMTVQVRDSELIGSELVTQGTTDVNGQYSFVVDNDDGFGAGDRDIFVRIRTANSAVSIETAGIFGSAYEANSSVQDEVPDGTTINENFTCANTGTGPSCGLLTGATYVAAYAAQLNSSSFLNQIVLEWPGSATSANYDGSDINLRPGDRWDWDVMFHEYGHYVMDTFNFENNPGGPHNIGDCVSDVQGSKSLGVRLAWAEGWPTFFGTAGQVTLNLAALNVPRVGDTVYADTGESNFSYNLESQSNIGIGEDNEVAVQRVLWDLIDTPADGRDNVDTTAQSLFDIISPSGVTTLSGAWGVIRLLLSNAEDLDYGDVVADHLIGPNLIAPAASSIQGPNTVFSWNRNVGCSTTFDGDDFDLVFYNTANFAKLLTIPGIGGTSQILSDADYTTLVASSHFLLWAVEGRNGDSPATGSYLGESFAITLNKAPVADAGPDQVKECTAPTGATVTMDGTNSSDADNDPFSYLWTSPGITFSNPNSATPDATFPKGSKVVTLTVDDGIESDSDTMTATVVDTTPPVIDCPDDIVAECTGNGGVPADDPLIVAFLTGATATDSCDISPIITHNAPAFFPLGENLITFTATDVDNNSAQCDATVDVVDTIPPEISVSVNPTSLWPPNHKLVDIVAEVIVTDICDVNPTFVLTSITSNEPDNGLGDGNTVNDIQNAAFGTADTNFKLRAERQGTGDGRVYTITYTAEDQSGNTAQTSVEVTVSHNQ